MACVFCSVAEKQAPAKIIHEDESCVAFHDLNPQAPTHVLIIPRKHIATLNDLGEEDAPLVGHMHLLAKRIAAELGVAEKGYRTVFNCNREAGQSVFHLHLHLLGGRSMSWPPG